MPLSNKQPNSQIDIDQFSSNADALFQNALQPSISKLLDTPGRLLSERMELLRHQANEIDRPILKQFATDMVSVMSSWLDDPEVLCCLIQGIWSAYTSTKEEIDDFRREISLNQTEFGKFIDTMITFIDFIIVFLTQDIKKLSLLIPDIIKELMDSIMGMVLLIIQETLFSLRDSAIGKIFGWMDEWDTNKVWSKCLPLKQMIDILKRYVHDYGLLANLLEKIKGFTSGKKSDWAKRSKLALSNAKDLEFLYWLRDLLMKLKKAMINFDFCIEYEFVARPLGEDDGDGFGPGAGDDGFHSDLPANGLGKSNTRDPDISQGYGVASDNTILIDNDPKTNNDKYQTSDNNVGSNNSNIETSDGRYITRVSNSFIREFIHKEYGIPYEVIENTITRGSSSDHIQGTNVTSDYENVILDRCSNTPTGQEIVRFMLNLKNRTT